MSTLGERSGAQKKHRRQNKIRGQKKKTIEGGDDHAKEKTKNSVSVGRGKYEKEETCNATDMTSTNRRGGSGHRQ